MFKKPTEINQYAIKLCVVFNFETSFAHAICSLHYEII